jgi:nicotinamidase-related amidase
MAVWDDVLPESDKQVFDAAGYGKRQGYGSRPAVIVVDVSYNFVGDTPEPILDSIKRYRNSCGEQGWESVKSIKKLLDSSRAKNLPIIYTTAPPRRKSVIAGRWAGKNYRAAEIFTEATHEANAIVEEIAPQEEDILIFKDKPSAFFGTPLISYLTELQVDSLIIAGTVTSGCVLATVLDGFSHNFKVSVVEECVFDRGEMSHKVTLFNMHAWAADVVTLEDVEDYLAELPENLF